MVVERLIKSLESETIFCVDWSRDVPLTRLGVRGLSTIVWRSLKKPNFYKAEMSEETMFQ